MYNEITMKLENRIGNWKYVIRKNHQLWRNISAGLKDYFKLQNEFQRFLTAEPVSAKEAKRSFFRKSKGNFFSTVLSLPVIDNITLHSFPIQEKGEDKSTFTEPLKVNHAVM